jgi:hypothetical protein
MTFFPPIALIQTYSFLGCGFIRRIAEIMNTQITMQSFVPLNWPVRVSGMVQANVGQKLLKRNIFKSFLRDRFRVGDATFR